MPVTYWLLLIVATANYGGIEGTQPDHYANERACKTAGDAVLARYPKKQISVAGSMLNAPADLTFKCMPVYQ